MQDSPALERLTITMPSELASCIREAVATGGYATSSEVVREALREWQANRALRVREYAALTEALQQGLSDLAEGRVREFDPSAIVERGRRLLARRADSA